MTPDTPADVSDALTRALAPELVPGSEAGEVVDPAPEVFVPYSERPWPRPWMGVFLDTLSRVPFVSSAAEAARINRQHVYDVRNQNPAFAYAWDEALGRAEEMIERVAHRWSTTGLPRVETRRKQLFDKDGNVIGEEVITVEGTDMNPQLLALVLKRFKPEYRESVQFRHTGADGGPVKITHEARLQQAVDRFEGEVLRLSDGKDREAA